MSNVHIIRDHFCKGAFYVYIKASERYNNRWAIYQIGYPNSDDLHAPNISVHAMYYGQVRIGKIFPAYGGAWGTESGTWLDQSDAANGTNMDYLTRRSGAINSYVDILIPVDHNVIYLYVYDVTGSASLSFAWDDGTTTGLDVTSFTSVNTKVKTISIATNASPDGIKKLRVKQSSAGFFRFLGLQCWDSDSIGDPSTNVAGITVGHTPIMQLDCVTGTVTSLIRNTGSDPTFVRVSQDTTGTAYLWALDWGPEEGSLRYSGEGTHFITGATNYPFVLDAAYTTDGFTLTVDSTDHGGIYNLTNQPLGKIDSGSKITLDGTGYLNATTLTPDVVWIVTFDGNGMENSTKITWDGPVDFGESSNLPVIYPIMYAMNTSLMVAGSYISNYSGSYEQSIYGLTSDLRENIGDKIKVIFTNQDFEVILTNDNTPAEWYITHATQTPPSKIYARTDYTDLNPDPSTGESLTIHGKISIKKIESTTFIPDTYDNNFQDGKFPFGTNRIELLNEGRDDNALTLRISS
jgi:hypothetical protein